MSRHRVLTGTRGSKKANEDDLRAGCALVASGECSIGDVAREVGLSARSVTDYMHLYGYIPTTRGPHTRWIKKEDVNLAPTLPEPQPVDDIEQDEVGALYARLDRAAMLLKEANARLEDLDATKQKLNLLESEHAKCVEVRARLEHEIDMMRNDAEFGRAERQRQNVIRQRTSRELFDQQVVTLSNHLHPPKEATS